MAVLSRRYSLRYLLFFPILAFLSPFTIAAQESQANFAKTFGKHYEAALDILKRESRRIASAIGDAGGDPAILVPVVFPEIVRYSMVRDLFEQSAMLQLYVEQGPSAANFSVGPFQMKPRFAEQVEDAVRTMAARTRQNTAARLPAPLLTLLAYETADPVGERRERMRRLSSMDWQIRYLCAFQRIVEARFAAEIAAATAGMDAPSARFFRIRFYAECYNAGFDYPYDAIVQSGFKALYPDGPALSGRAAYRYTDVSLWFAAREYRDLFPAPRASETRVRP